MWPDNFIFLNERIRQLVENFEEKFNKINTPEQRLIFDTIKKIDMYLHLASFTVDTKMLDAYIDLLEQYLTYGYVQESTQNLMMNIHFETIEAAMLSLYAVCEREGILENFPQEYIGYYKENRELYAKQLAEYKAMNEKMEADRKAALDKIEADTVQNKLEEEDVNGTADSSNDIKID